MASLQKTFDGTNLPALVNKIVGGIYSPVPTTFSQDFRDLVQSMLEKVSQSYSAAQLIMQRPYLGSIEASVDRAAATTRPIEGC